MCGIAGIVNLNQPQPVDPELLTAMLSAIRHRGPDGSGIYRDDWAGLGSVRLSIIDIAGGDQPIGNEDGSLWIVFNGEIFNYVELRPLLEARGHHFTTHTDTEVILHLFEDEGPACLSRLNGQFALAIWDARRRSLFLARDRAGIRPLFYTTHAGRLVFGSEVKAILADPQIPAALDPQALREVFTYWSPLPPHSVFTGIQELPPAHYLTVTDGQVCVAPFWSLDFTPDPAERTTADYLDELDSLLIDAARIRLRADVPVGAYLSGGLDSSLTTAIIRGYTPNRLDTFSIAFSDPAFDESPHQQAMAAHLGTDHHIIRCDHQAIGEIFPEVIWHTETPILRTAPAPMYLLSKLVRKHQFKVVMTGEGADEFLAGYDIFKEMKIRRFWAADPQSALRPKLLARLYPDINGLNASAAFQAAFFKKDLDQTASPFYSHLIRWKNTARAWRFLAADGPGGPGIPNFDETSLPLPADFAAWPPLSQAQYLEITTFLAPYLLSSQGDRMAMANSVEGRYPFLDYRVMEFCAHLPARLKMPVLVEKWLLKQLGRRYLPDSIWKRVKRPYRAPIHRSFFPAQPLAYVDDLLSEPALNASGLFDPRAVQKLVSKARAATSGAAAGGLSEMEDMALVGILSTQLVERQFISGRRAPGASTLTHTRVIDHTTGR